MARRKRRWRWLVGCAALAVWAVSFYRAYTGLAIPAFGPADQATEALQQLVLRYGAILAAGGAGWFGIERVLKRRAAKAKRGRSGTVSTSV